MGKGGFSRLEVVRIVEGLEPYPAVLLPAAEGGYEVVLTNFPGARSYGVKRETALLAGAELLTAEVMRYILESQAPPRPSDPNKLIAGDDEPPGSELVMLEADRAILRKRLGLSKPIKGEALKSLGRLGKKS